MRSCKLVKRELKGVGYESDVESRHGAKLVMFVLSSILVV